MVRIIVKDCTKRKINGNNILDPVAVIRVKVYPNSKRESVEREGDTWIVRVMEPAKEGKANEAVVKVLRRFFRHVKLLRGRKSRLKLFEVE